MRISGLIKLTVSLVLFPARALAVQEHSGIAGLVSHELGHLLFLSGIIIFFIWIRSYHERGWPAFRSCLGFLLAWNILTVSGHILQEFQDQSRFIRSGDKIIGYNAESLLDFYFYLTLLDHFLLVPAFALLLTALLQWRSNRNSLPRPELQMAPAPENEAT